MIIRTELRSTKNKTNERYTQPTSQIYYIYIQFPNAQLKIQIIQLYILNIIASFKVEITRIYSTKKDEDRKRSTHTQVVYVSDLQFHRQKSRIRQFLNHAKTQKKKVHMKKSTEEFHMYVGCAAHSSEQFRVPHRQ